MVSIKSDLVNKNLSSNSLRQFNVHEAEDEYSDDNLAEINQSLVSRGLPPIDERSYAEMLAKNHQHNHVNQQQERPSAKSYFSQDPPIDENINDFERQPIPNKIKRPQGKERLSDAAKKRIEMLCGISRNLREIIIDGNIYVIRTLKSKELLDALISASKLDGTISLPFHTRKELLARALVKVAGTDVSLFLGDDSIEARMEFLDELDEPLIEKLYKEYSDLVNDVSKRYGINSEAESKEVAEDIKK